MSLPTSVQKSVDEANKLLEQAANPAPAAAEATPETPVENSELTPEQKAAPTEEPQKQEAQPVETPEQTPEQLAAYWEHRFIVMQGKYNSEVPALRSEISTLKAQTQASPDTALDAVNRVKGLTDAEIEEFGPELVAVIQKVAGANAGESERLEKLEQKIAVNEQQQASSVEDLFWNGLRKAVPDYLEVNDKPEFRKWLAQIDQMAGKPRQTLLVEAEAANDSGRVAAIFNAFKGSAAPSVNTPPKVPEQNVEIPQSRNESPVPNQARIWTGVEIKTFYANVTKGLYAHDPEGKAAIEQDIQLASTQGRIRA